MPAPESMLMTTVCATPIRRLTLAWVTRIDLARREQSRGVHVWRTERSSSSSLPRFLVLGIGLVEEGLSLVFRDICCPGTGITFRHPTVRSPQ